MITLWLATALAVDIPAVNADPYRPSVDTSRWVVADDARRLEGFAGALGVHYVHRPLFYVSADGEETDVVSGALAVDLTGAWGIGPIRVGLAAPAYAWVGSQVEEGWPTALGDGTLDVKGTVLEVGERPVGLAVVGRLGVPLGGWQKALGQSSVWWEIGLVGELELGSFGAVLEVGTRGLPATELVNIGVDDQLFYRFGVAWIPSEWQLGLEGWGHLQYTAMDNLAAPALELMLTGTHRTKAGRRIHVGVGTGLTQGIGVPVARIVVGIGHRPPSELLSGG